MFHRVLIANRGEIAVRIAATLQQMGIAVVAVYSDPDRASLHVSAADEAYPLGGTTSSETYLDARKILDIARQCHAEAVHPGYGFLAENADFAQSCRDAGITFIGPSPNVIRAMGDKLHAKTALAKAGVPVLPGFSCEGESRPSAINKNVEKLGFPVLVKAVAGGGGKGMRVVTKAEELAAALEAAQREARAAFGDGRVFVEKFLPRPRHVEVQILGDSHGNVVHLFERECSIQRRHQKILEETPAPGLPDRVRQALCDAAVRAATAIGYDNAGTVEFLVNDAGEFYFLEVNARLQVEHGVTEMVVQQDLVRCQVLVAAGERLPFAQEHLHPVGHAIEARICAEDAARGFLPATGTIEGYVAPAGPGIRVDAGVTEGTVVSPHYDSLLGKLIAWDRTREEAIRRLHWALSRYVVLGVTTNIPFLRALLDHTEFRAGRTHTQFLAEHQIAESPEATPSREIWLAAGAALQCLTGNGYPSSATGSRAGHASNDPWAVAGAWRAC